LNPESFGAKRFADNLKEATGIDMEKETFKRAVKESAQGGTPTGYYDREGVKRGAAVLGIGGAGYLAGSEYGHAIPGAGVGVIAGLIRNKYGKTLGTQILQKIQKTNAKKKVTPDKNQMLRMAEEYARGGNKKLAATYYVMSQRNQNLREPEDE
jgi:hypothetical protein